MLKIRRIGPVIIEIFACFDLSSQLDLLRRVVDSVGRSDDTRLQFGVMIVINGPYMWYKNGGNPTRG